MLQVVDVPLFDLEPVSPPVAASEIVDRFPTSFPSFLHSGRPAYHRELGTELVPVALSGEFVVPVDPASLVDCEGCQ